MAVYEYVALDHKGKKQKGVISADSSRQARKDLQERQLMPVSLDKVDKSAEASSLGKWLGGGRIGNKELAMLTRQLATMINAAAPVEEALSMTAEQVENPAASKKLMAVRARVMEGRRFSEALALYPNDFNQFYRSLIASGEVSGALGQVLERLADHLEKSQQLRNKILTATLYPAMLALVAVVVVIILMTFIVPKVAGQFESMGQTLPFLTRTMIFLSDMMRDYGIFILLALALAILLFLRQLKQEKFRRRCDGWMLRLPLIGKLVRGLYAARLARTLSTLIASGSPVMEGLRSAGQTMQNLVMREAVEKMVTQISEGSSLSRALRNSGVFPGIVVYMAGAGEKSGQLPDMLEKSADYLEGDFETFIATALSLLEPGIIIIMGAIVALIVLSILLPILQLNTMALG
ncbi:type II secretion system inner membrane protein GspF [Emcibacter nanhaiensis]|uniref:Type II secretion system protein GspF n=1 Tax=Emcibacter nanhaiensis TaxID=1505037 RepID=A0A501PSE2_9PROT|nr:type II secretion system inner membrane protein GspF [Emcibacter nanhaiensis]TPD62641.1 type II secretion system protein GspF [Emcibacter nanhaiensis]